MRETDLVDLFLQTLGSGLRDPSVILGPGDDCALIAPGPKHHWAVTTDVMVSDVHFPAGLRADLVGYRSVAVSLSDLAAMGAAPRYVTIALTHPDGKSGWIAQFARGVSASIREQGVVVLGGNLARGELHVAVTAIGSVLPGSAWLRSGARAGDDVWMTGRIGASSLALAQLPSCRLPSLEDMLDQRQASPVYAFLLPRPRFDLVAPLGGHVHSAIDLSDGLAGDLRHLAKASGTQLIVDAELLSVWPGADLYGAVASDDSYELLFTSPESSRPALDALREIDGADVSRIGSVAEGTGIRLLSLGDEAAPSGGYQHFR